MSTPDTRAKCCHCQEPIADHTYREMEQCLRKLSLAHDRLSRAELTLRQTELQAAHDRQLAHVNCLGDIPQHHPARGVLRDLATALTHLTTRINPTLRWQDMTTKQRAEYIEQHGTEQATAKFEADRQITPQGCFYYGSDGAVTCAACDYEAVARPVTNPLGEDPLADKAYEYFCLSDDCPSHMLIHHINKTPTQTQETNPS